MQPTDILRQIPFDLAVQYLRMPNVTLDKYLRDTGIEPVVPAPRRGVPRMLTLQQVWALGIARSARAGGQSLENCVDIANHLSRLKPDRICRAFDEDRSILLATILEDKLWLYPDLVEPSAITGDAFDNLRKSAAKMGKTAIVTGVDVRPMLLQLVHASREKAKGKPKATNPRRRSNE